MQVWIDDKQMEQADSIEAAFELARKHTESAGRLIIDISADGDPIDEALLDNPPSDSTAGIQQLRLTTTDHRAFLTETIHSAKEALTLTREDQSQAADLLRTGELENAAESLRAVLEGWQAVRDVVGQSAALAGIDINELSFEGTTGAACVEKLSKTLEEILATLGRQDWSALGDALEYDLDEQAVCWDRMLDEMIAHIKADG